MKESTRKRLYTHLTQAVVGRFAGFVLGLWSSQFVSVFFETRSSKNLWGLLASKPLVNKSTFSEMEWVMSIIIGFIVSELVNKFFKEKLEDKIPYIHKINRYFLLDEEKKKEE